MHDTTFIFAGPSLFEAGVDTRAEDDITWLPPVRRGDIERLLDECKTPGVIGLADGTFHAYPSVSHIELREAIEAGWRVYALCSIGAIRASEMRHLGMIPWGRVAEVFCRQRDFADDEVALVHGSEAPYAPLSEPLVHIREFCAKAQDRSLLSAAQALQVVESLRQRWYGDRTLANLRRELGKVLGAETLTRDLAEATDNFTPFRLKQADLKSFLANRPWQQAAAQ